MAKRAKRKPKPRPIYVSKKLELDYTRALLKIVKAMHKDTVAALMPLLEQPNVGDGVMVADGLFNSFKSAFKSLSDSTTSAVTSIATSLATLTVNKQRKESDAQLIKIIFEQTGIDFSGLMKDEALTEAVDEAIAANVSLINSVPKQYLERVEQAVLAGLQSGMLKTTLADDLAQIEGVTKRRAQLIARDQLGKINSRLSQLRQQSLGITHYFWSTSHDERVRPRHRRWDGDRIAWDKPPPDGHPGQAIRCRCVAIPDMSNFEI